MLTQRNMMNYSVFFASIKPYLPVGFIKSPTTVNKKIHNIVLII